MNWFLIRAMVFELFFFHHMRYGSSGNTLLAGGLGYIWLGEILRMIVNRTCCYMKTFCLVFVSVGVFSFLATESKDMCDFEELVMESDSLNFP